jgi:hypothetical protein
LAQEIEIQVGGIEHAHTIEWRVIAIRNGNVIERIKGFIFKRFPGQSKEVINAISRLNNKYIIPS